MGMMPGSYLMVIKHILLNLFNVSFHINIEILCIEYTKYRKSMKYSKQNARYKS